MPEGVFWFTRGCARAHLMGVAPEPPGVLGRIARGVFRFAGGCARAHPTGVAPR